MNRLVYICFILVLNVEVFSQQQLSVQAVDALIIIDGILEEAWEQSDSSSLFVQLEPSIGALSSRRTIIRSLMDKDALYFSFQCFMDSPEELAARIQGRDQLDDSDDMVSLLLDSYNDGRTALLFQVNPLGTQADAKISDDGKEVDYLWDARWAANISINDSCWIAEIRIPLEAIQFKTRTDSWGCNFSRTIRANREVSWWSPVTESYRVSQSGRLDNLDFGNRNKHRLELFPYGTLRYENSDISGAEDDIIGDGGVDIQYSYSSNVKANLTLNPDFATVEGDKEQINLTPWELQHPEKRLFFQDGNEMFKTRIQTFYSRRIGDVLYGGKVVGKVDKYQFNGLFAQTKEDSDLGIPGAKYNAFRVKRDFLESSTLGLSYTDKITDTAIFHTFSFDYVMNLGKTWKLTGQFVSSLPGDLWSHSAWYVRFARENNTYHYHVRFTSLGENFQDNVNETGYAPDDDRLEVDSDVSYKFWFDNFLSYLKLSGKNNVFWSQEGELRSWYLTWGGRSYLDNNLSFDFYYNNEYKLLDKDYYNYFYKGVLGYRTDESSNAAVAYRRGVNFDRNFDLLELSTRFQLFKKLSVSYEFDYLNFSPDPGGQSTILNVLGLDYYFTRDLWMRVFTQHNTSNDKIYLYGLFGWRFKPPFGALYLIVNSDNYYDFDRQSDLHSDIIFLKLTYPLSLVGK